MISVSDARQEHTVPDEVKSLGHLVVKVYIEERIKKIEEHNENVLVTVCQDTLKLREATRGAEIVICPGCGEEVAWGRIMTHRIRCCKI